jgi:hypothetical protein
MNNYKITMQRVTAIATVDVCFKNKILQNNTYELLTQDLISISDVFLSDKVKVTQINILSDQPLPYSEVVSYFHLLHNVDIVTCVISHIDRNKKYTRDDVKTLENELIF